MLVPPLDRTFAIHVPQVGIGTGLDESIDHGSRSGRKQRCLATVAAAIGVSSVRQQPLDPIEAVVVDCRVQWGRMHGPAIDQGTARDQMLHHSNIGVVDRKDKRGVELPALGIDRGTQAHELHHHIQGCTPAQRRVQGSVALLVHGIDLRAFKDDLARDLLGCSGAKENHTHIEIPSSEPLDLFGSTGRGNTIKDGGPFGRGSSSIWSAVFVACFSDC